MMRLNKFIASAGVTSRRAADDIIASGRVTVNGKRITEMGHKVDEHQDLVRLDGKTIRIVMKKVYIILNKPKDVITTAKDERGRKTVFDIVNVNVRLFPVGRLDYKSEGLLLLTNDGELAQRLTHPSYKVPKTYRSKLNKPFDEKDFEPLITGVELEDGMTLPCRARRWGEDDNQVDIQLREGRNRQVRRMFEALGYEVKKLKRISFGPLKLVKLNRGEWRHLSPTELRLLKGAVALIPQNSGRPNKGTNRN